MPRNESDVDEDLSPPLADELAELRSRHLSDPPAAVLRAVGTGALPAEVEEEARRTLAESRWHRTLVEAVEASHADLDAADQDRVFRRVMTSAGRPSAARRHTSGRTWRLWVPVLATAAAVAVIVGGVRLSRTAPSATTPGAVVSAPAVAIASRAFHLPLDKPAVRLTALALVLRSAGGDAAFNDDIAPALAAYQGGDYRGAARALEPLEARYPTAVEVPFYLGASRLLSNDAPGAWSALARAARITDETFRPDVTWYLAVAAERAGRLRDARAQLDTLCRGASEYRARACAALPSFPPE